MHMFICLLLMWLNPFTLLVGVLDGCFVAMGCLPGSGMLILNIMHMFGYDSSWLGWLGEPWTRDRGIPQGRPLSMMFIVALYLPWCRHLEGQILGFILSYMQMISNVSLTIPRYFWWLLGLLLGMSEWLGRSPRLANMCFNEHTYNYSKRYERLDPPCCAVGEVTRGHNAATTLVHAAAQSCDCTAEMEVPGLIPGTDLRPADVLTSALGNSYTALDISICSPHVQPAGADCTQTRHEAKLAHYGPHLPSLVRQNISYTPIVWSACGRPHRDTLTVLRSLSKSIARKRNFVSAEVVYQKLHASITLEIWKRSARQIRACWALAALPVSRTQNHSSCPGLGPLSCVGQLSCVVPPVSLFWSVSSLRRALLSLLSRFTCSVLGLGRVPRSPAAVWPRSCPPSPIRKPRLRMMFKKKEEEGNKWFVKLGSRDLGGRLDTAL